MEGRRKQKPPRTTAQGQPSEREPNQGSCFEAEVLTGDIIMGR